MKKVLFIYLSAMIMIFTVAPRVDAVLQDYQDSTGNYFYDTDTSLFWFTPVTFLGQTRSEVDSFITSSSIWNWASSDEIDALSGKSSEGGVPLTEIMGEHQFQTTSPYDGGKGSRWLGYYESGGQPTGWGIQTALTPTNLSLLDQSGSQYNVENWNHGAWVNTSVDITVVPEPISSILFIAGGATLGFRRFRKKFLK